MKYAAHLTAGTVAAAAVASVAEPSAGAVAALGAGALAGSLAPDLDHPESLASRRCRPLRWLLVIALSNPLTWWWAGSRERCRAWLRHRGLLHSLLGLGLGAVGAGLSLWGLSWGLVGLGSWDTVHPVFGVVSPAALSWWVGGMTLGYSLHLGVDMLTGDGVPLLYPIERRFCLLPSFLRGLLS